MSREFDPILISGSDFLEIRINRPAQRNALTDDMVAQITSHVSAAAKSSNVRAIIIRGNAGVFCSGADLGQIADVTSENGMEQAVQKSRCFAKMCQTISTCPIPVITVVDGPAVGGGFGLACTSDICIAGPQAKFGFSAQRIGAMPGPIIPFVVERAGYSITKMLAVTGQVLPAERALMYGIAHEMVDDVDACLTGYLAQIRACGPQAVRLTKGMVIDNATMAQEKMIERACDLFGDVITSEEGMEGMMAFKEKRKPSWNAD